MLELSDAGDLCHRMNRHLQLGVSLIAAVCLVDDVHLAIADARETGNSARLVDIGGGRKHVPELPRHGIADCDSGGWTQGVCR